MLSTELWAWALTNRQSLSLHFPHGTQLPEVTGENVPVADSPLSLSAALLFPFSDSQPGTWSWKLTGWDHQVYFGSSGTKGRSVLGDMPPHFRGKRLITRECLSRLRGDGTYWVISISTLGEAWRSFIWQLWTKLPKPYVHFNLEKMNLRMRRTHERLSGHPPLASQNCVPVELYVLLSSQVSICVSG